MRKAAHEDSGFLSTGFLLYTLFNLPRSRELHTLPNEPHEQTYKRRRILHETQRK